VMAEPACRRNTDAGQRTRHTGAGVRQSASPRRRVDPFSRRMRSYGRAPASRARGCYRTDAFETPRTESAPSVANDTGAVTSSGNRLLARATSSGHCRSQSGTGFLVFREQSTSPARKPGSVL
jgi:hypothetical protein